MLTVQAAVKNAIDAERQWQAELDQLHINRWSNAAKGVPGTFLNVAYKAKIEADKEMAEAFRLSRQSKGRTGPA